MTVEKKRNLAQRFDNLSEINHDTISLQDLTDLVIEISSDVHIIEIQNNSAAGKRINSNILKLKRALNMFQYRVNKVRKEMSENTIPRPANNSNAMKARAEHFKSRA